MAKITITAPDETGTDQTAIIEYADAYKGQLTEALAEHFCYPIEVEVDGARVPNTQSRFQYVANRVTGDLIRLAFQQVEQQQMAAARQKLLEERDAALGLSVGVVTAG